MLGRRLAAACLILVASMAGCVGGQESLETTEAPGELETSTTSGSAAAADHEGSNPGTIEAPTWSLRDAWHYQSPQAPDLTLVVTEDLGQDWRVDTTSQEAAFFDARFDISFMGEVGKDELRGSQGEDRVRFFDFPLTEGKSWTTTWDGVQRQVAVTGIDGGVASLEARQDGRLAVAYTYDAEAGFFGELTFYDENETVTISNELQRTESNFTGEVARWTLLGSAGFQTTLQPAAPPLGISLEVPEEATDLWASFSVTCPSGAYSVGIGHESSEQGWGLSQPCPDERSFEEVIVEDPAPGQWDGGVVASSPAEQGHLAFEVLVRSLELVPVPAS